MSTRIRSSVSKFALVRHRTTYRLGLIFVCAAVWTCSTALAAMVALRTTRTVRVYQTAGLPSMLEQRALAEAEIVLRSAFVDVRWRKCTGLARSEACSSPPAPLELLLVVRDGAPCQDTSATLGEALVVRHAGGMLATVYFNCVEWFAMSARTDVAVLLGRVAAHELGHLMMHTSAHALRGLMRPNWTPHEVRRNRLGLVQKQVVHTFSSRAWCAARCTGDRQDDQTCDLLRSAWLITKGSSARSSSP